VLLSRSPQPGYVWAEKIGVYIHQSAYVVYLDALIEVTDEKFDGLVHGRRATYKRGCHGPLCKKDMRDYGRVYQRAKFRPERTRDTYKQRFDEILNLVLKAYQKSTGKVEKVEVAG
jgi:hypothetical protein